MVQCNILLILFLAAFAAATLGRRILAYLNIRHLRRHGHEVPAVFQGEIDDATLGRMTEYTIESSRFASREGLFDDGITLAVVLSGFLPWLAGHILGAQLHFVWSGLLFFGFLSLMSGIIGIPFSIYSTFVIERKYGFGTTTLKLWLTDLMKGFVISVILFGLLFGAFFTLMVQAPKSWWFWTWLVFASFQLFMLWIYPVVIAPLFNKYTPVADVALMEAIVSMMAKVGLRAQGVYQVDEGKRSRHTNAYFTGLGKTKRIVLYDTLLASHTAQEILSILAHEVGHWKKKHILKQLVFMEVISLLIFYILYRLIDWPLLYLTFGFNQAVPYVGLLLLAILVGPLAFFCMPLTTAVMRKFEREADAFSLALMGTAKPLCQALKRLAKDNLANLHPHPLYARFYYSHPPLTDRIARLKLLEEKGASKDGDHLSR